MVSPLDDLVGPQEQRLGDREAEGLRGLEVDHQLDLGRLLHREIARLRGLRSPTSSIGRARGYGAVDPYGVDGGGTRRLLACSNE
jgi:hypothetical protein